MGTQPSPALTTTDCEPRHVWRACCRLMPTTEFSVGPGALTPLWRSAEKAFEGLPTSEFMTLTNTNHVDREVVKILQGRESDVLLILKSRRTSNP